MIARFAPTLSLALLLAGCTSTGGDTKATPAPYELTERAEPTKPREAPDPGPPAAAVAGPATPSETEFGAELPPEELKDKLGISGYKFTPRSEESGTNASISLTLENLQDSGNMVYEISARFNGVNGDSLVQTEWARVTLKPRKRFFYKSESSDLRTASGRVLIRRIEDTKP